MRVTYDPKADAAYIYLGSKEAKAKKTYPCDPLEVNGMINLDFDENGILIGIEILDARAKLPKEILDIAEKI